ncbi:restriction endonuclease subunit S [Natrononativus amylolyticus]|uniref:restriction endonuclease subunit S n=1 Tax=Natrononativus amylolyticus TaxID=2963434 RepID=UPI0020CB7C50|nr:restriction endonuclease subunit S [Natrononativus amylolyticus]
MNYPESWPVAELQELGEWQTGSTPRRSNDEYWGGDILWVSPKDMKTDRIDQTQDRMTEKALEETNSKLIPPNSIVMVTRSGILEHSFPVAVTERPVTINQDLKAFIPGDRLDESYAYYYLRASEFDILRTCTKDGTTVASINSDSLYTYEMPIPPVGHQERIVAKIEELFSKLDSGVSELEESQGRFNLYKKAILNEALEGGFSEEFYQKEDVESGATIAEIEAPANAPELPSIWKWVPFDDVLSEPLRNGKSAKQSEEGIRTLTLSAVTERDFSKKNTKITEANPKDVEDLWLQSGDLLIERSNTEEYVGLPAVYRGDDDYAIYPDLMIRARLDDSLAIPEYADYVFLSPFFRNYLRGKSKGTSGSMAKINQKHLRNMPFPLAPLEEQEYIVKRLDYIMSVVDESQKSVGDELKRAQRLRQSILKQAFEGNIIPQEPTEKAPTMDAGNANLEPGKQVTLSEVTNDAE